MAAEPEKKRSRFARKPKDPSAEPGRVAQLRQVYTQTQAQDPKVGLYMGGAFLLAFLVCLLIGVLIGSLFYLVVFIIFGLLFGTLAAMFILGRRAQTAAYSSISGQPGATGAALQSLRRGWLYEQEPVAAEAGRARSVRDMNQAAMVFRAVGRPGVVLIAEGPKGAANKLLTAESKRVTRVSGPEVPVHTLRVGQGEGAVPVKELTKTMNKLPTKLTKDEVGAVTKRLRALGSAKPPIPQGMDPRNARMDRKSLRGR